MEFDELVQAVQSLNAEDTFRARLDIAQWRSLGGYLTQHPLRAGELLLRQGEVDRSAYFLGQGSLQVYSDEAAGAGGSRVVLLRPGALVGETGLFAAVPHTANVEAMSACVVWALRLPRFEELCSRMPALALEVLRGAGGVMAARLRAHLMRQAALA
ncbi:MAG: cyclic nucleotide-binding domain-containing protein [Burkholderiales bacterium]